MSSRLLSFGFLAIATTSVAAESVAAQQPRARKDVVPATSTSVVHLDSLLRGQGLRAGDRAVAPITEGGFPGVRVADGDGPAVVWIQGVALGDGEIELDIRGRDEVGKSFPGIAFNAQSDTVYEVAYLRPFNFRAADPVRRKHAVQYMSLPQYPWSRLRRSRPGAYEQPVDPAPDPNGWVHVRIVVAGSSVSIFVGDDATPDLQVQRLTTRRKGAIGLSGPGDYANLRVRSAGSNQPVAREGGARAHRMLSPLAGRAAREKWKTVNRSIRTATIAGRPAIRMEPRPMTAQAGGIGGEGLVYDDSMKLADGDIELDILAADDFVGLAFRIQDEHTYDAVYFRPQSFVTQDTGARAQAIQYISHPGASWSRLRETAPEIFEARLNAPIALGEWFHVRVQLAGESVRVYLNHSTEPAIDVASQGGRKPGSAGLWVGNGSGGSFANLALRPRHE